MIPASKILALSKELSPDALVFFNERIGFMCGSLPPTEAQLQCAWSETQRWLERAAAAGEVARQRQDALL